MSARPHGITRAEMAGARLPRRRLVNRTMELLATLAAATAVGVLGLLVYSVARRGAGALNWDLLTKPPSTDFLGTTPGGVANAIAGSLVVVGLAAAMTLPVGILAAIFLSEYARPRVRSFVSLMLDVLAGVPAIVIGIFVYGLLVVGSGSSGNGWDGAFALSILMLPFVTRSVQEVLALVPAATREASLALGVPRWRTTLSVVLPQTIGGIVTGATLAIARVAGETAPLLFLSSIVGQHVSWNPSHGLQTIPVTIFQYSEQPDPKLHAQAWAIGFVLLVFILVANLGARALAGRNRRRLTSR
jgi:phosphate transport system permease protein